MSASNSTHARKYTYAYLHALTAKREWPHQWPTLFTQLTQLSQHSDAHCEMVLLILGEMGEGLFSDDKMTDGRRNELLVALNAEFPALFTFCYKVLEDNFVDCKFDVGHNSLRALSAADGRKGALVLSSAPPDAPSSE